MSRVDRARLFGVLAVLLTALSVVPLVQGTTWLLELAAVVVAAALAATGVARLTRRAWVAVPVQVVVALLGLTWLYALPEAFLGVLPGPAALARLGDLLAAGLELSNSSAPPVPSPDGLRLLVVGGLLLVALLVDLLAVTLRLPAAAGLPLLALYCVPAALARGGLDWWWFVPAAAGFLLLLAAESGDRVTRWGRVVRGRSAGGDSRAPLAATGRRVGAASLVVAVLVPALVPGLSEALIGGSGEGDGEGGSSTISVVNPMLSLRNDLTANTDTEVLRYTTTDETPDPLRLVTVDSFDGDTWQPTYGEVDRNRQVTDLMTSPPGLSEDQPVTEATTTVTISSLVQNWLPAPYPPRRVDIEGGPWLYDESTLNIVGDDDATTAPGLEYVVQSLLVEPDPAVLEQAGPAPSEVVERWTEVPDDLPPVIAATAAEVVAGAATPFDRAVALQAWFRSAGGFRYTLEAPPENGSSAVADFLDRRSGYCVHFASSMALMARTLGIPSRVAVGFLPGEARQDGSFSVTQQDVHAWPELYFEGAGWMRFEPTPATRTGSLPGWATPTVEAPEPGASPSASASAPVPAPADVPSTNEESGSDDGSGVDLLGTLRSVPWRVVAALLVVLVVVAAPAVSARVARRRRWSRARDDGERAEAAWAVLTERLLDLGVTWPSALTLRETTARVGDGMDDVPAAALARLAAAVEDARYGDPLPPAPPPGRPARGELDGAVAVLDLADASVVGAPSVADRQRDVDLVAAAVAARRPRGHLWRARLLPPSGLQHLRGWLQGVGARFDRADRAVASRVQRRPGRVRR